MSKSKDQIAQDKIRKALKLPKRKSIYYTNSATVGSVLVGNSCTRIGYSLKTITKLITLDGCEKILPDNPSSQNIITPMIMPTNSSMLYDSDSIVSDTQGQIKTRTYEYYGLDTSQPGIIARIYKEKPQ